MAANEEMLEAIPPAPPPGEIVDEQRLYLTQISQWRNTLAFGGTTNPSVIWSSMSRNEATAILYYRELEDKDEDVGNCLDTLKLAVLQRDRLVTPGEDTTQGHEIADFIQAQFDELPNFHQILDSMLDASGYGFSVAEMIFDVSEGQVELEDVRDRPQELFLFGNRFRPQVGALQLLPSPWAMDGEQMPEQKFLVSTYRQRGGNRMGRPLLRSVFWPSWFKRNDLRMWLQYAEKGPGTAAVQYDDSASEQQKQLAAELAKALVERNAVAVPRNFTYDKDLLTSARVISPDVYVTLFRAMQYNIARRILGETLTSFGASESGKGSQAQGEVHADTLEQRIIELCRGLASVINRQLVRPLVLWNYGPDAPMPKWGFDLEEEEDLSKRIVIDSALQRMGKGISEKYVVDRYSIPASEPEDKLLVPNVNAPQVALQARDISTFMESMAALRPEDAPVYLEASAKISAFAEDIKMSPEMAHDHAEFDVIMEELKRESLRQALAPRTKEVIDALLRGQR